MSREKKQMKTAAWALQDIPVSVNKKKDTTALLTISVTCETIFKFLKSFMCNYDQSPNTVLCANIV